MSIRDLIRARMSRMGGGSPSRGGGPSRRPSNNGRDVDMHARNQRLSRPSARPSGGGAVPGLPGLRFADDYGQAMRTAAQSSADFHSGDIERMRNHPAVGWSKSMAGIDGLAGSEIDRIRSETDARLTGKGITRDSTGSYRLGQNQVTGASLSGKVPQPGLGGVPPLGQSRAGSNTPLPQANANGGTVTMGDIPANTKLNVDVSGGTQIANGQQTTGTPGSTSIGGTIRAAVEAALQQAKAPAPTSGGSRPQPNTPTAAGKPGYSPPMVVPAGLGGTPGQPQTPAVNANPNATGTLVNNPMDPAPTASPAGGPASADMRMSIASQEIIRQETGGQDLTGQTNCTIRPQSGCLALNSGIFETTAQSLGMDFNRIVNDPVYANQAVNALLTSYADDDASKWGGPSGMTVWDWGNQNLPGGGMEAVARIYFGGEVNGTFVDEQGRSGATYGQQFMDKMYAQGYDPAAAAQPSQEAPTQAPTTPPQAGVGMNPTGPLQKQGTAQPGYNPQMVVPAGLGGNVGQPQTPATNANPNATGTLVNGLPLMEGGQPLNTNGPYANTNIPPGSGRAAPLPSPGLGVGSMPNTGPLLSNTTQMSPTSDSLPAGLGGTGNTTGGTATNQPSFNTSFGYQNPQSQGIAAPSPTQGAAPAGPIQAPLVSPNAQGGSWDSVAPYEQYIQKAVAAYPEVDPAMVRSAIMMESLGDPYAKNPASSSFGVLQIQPEWHRESAAQMGIQLSDANTGFSNPEGDIMYWTALMAGKAPGQQVAGNTPMERYYNNYGTGDAYFQDIQSMMDEQHAMAPTAPTQPGRVAPPPGGFDPRLSGAMRNDVRGGELPTVSGGQLMPGSAVSGQRPSQQGMLVGEDAVQQPPTAANGGYFGGNSASLQGATTPQTGVMGGNSASKLGPKTIPIGQVPPSAGTIPGTKAQPRPATESMQMDVVAQPSGLLAAVDGTDESYMAKQADGVMPTITSPFAVPDTVAGPWYEYQVGHGGAANEHDGYDIGYVRGTQLNAPNQFLTGTVECVSCGSYCTGGVSADGGLYCDNVGVGEIRVKLDPAIHGGNQLTMLYGHMLTSDVQPGQQLAEGGLIGQTGYAGTGDHLHQEAWATCPGQGYDGDYKYVDPTLVANGYYATHDACSDGPAPAASGQQPAASGPSGGATTNPSAAPAYTPAASGYTPSDPGYYQAQESAPAMPAPSTYDTGVQTQNTGQIVVDQATGQQFEIMADGSARLIYDPSW